MAQIENKKTNSGIFTSINKGFYFCDDFLHPCDCKNPTELYNDSIKIVDDACKHYKNRTKNDHHVTNDKFLYQAFVFEIFCMLNNLVKFSQFKKSELLVNHIYELKKLLSLQRKVIKDYRKSGKDLTQLIHDYPCSLSSAKTFNIKHHNINLLYKNSIQISHGFDFVEYWPDNKVLKKPSNLIFKIFFIRLNFLITLSNQSNINSEVQLRRKNINELNEIFSLASIWISNNIMEDKNVDTYLDFLNDHENRTPITAELKNKLKDLLQLDETPTFTSKYILSTFYRHYSSPGNNKKYNLNLSDKIKSNLTKTIVRNFMFYQEETDRLSPNLEIPLTDFDLFHRAFVNNDKEAIELILNNKSDTIYTSLGKYISQAKLLNLLKLHRKI